MPSLPGTIGFGQIAAAPVAPGQAGKLNLAFRRHIGVLPVVIEERQGPSLLEALQPERGAAQLQGHGVAVYAEDAMGDHQAQGLAVVLGLDGALRAAQRGQALCQTARPVGIRDVRAPDVRACQGVFGSS